MVNSNNSNKWLFDCQKEFPQGPMKPIEDIDTNDDLNGMVIVTTTSASSSDTGRNIEADSEASSVMKFHDVITNNNDNIYYYKEAGEDRKDDDDDDTDQEREQDVAVTLATIVEEVEEQLEVQTSQTNSIDYCVAQNGTIIILDDRDDNNYDRCMYMREEEINSILRSTNSLIDDDHLHHDLILTEIDIGGDCDDDDDDLDDIEGLVKFCGLGYLLCKPHDWVTITC